MSGPSSRALVVALIAATIGVGGCSASGDNDHRVTTSAESKTTAAGSSATPVMTSNVAPKTPSAMTSAPASSSSPAARLTTATPAPRAATLPLRLPTGDAGQVITVTASSHTSTTGTLRAWSRVPGGWRAVGPAVPAYLGSDGIGQAGEQVSRTPSGSYTLTRAFGHDRNPGTSLPYVRTTPADWWISQAGPLYNTRQRCSAGCPFTQGAPNEQLYATMPFYRFAVVIDYNTANARGGVRPGAGSAFFLHVAVGEPTQGCVAIAQDQLVRLLRWLAPARHPRILLGVG